MNCIWCGIDMPKPNVVHLCRDDSRGRSFATFMFPEEQAMSVTGRMENDGMSFEDARMKESMTVSEAPATVLLQRLRSEAADALEGAQTCTLQAARPAFAMTAALLTQAADLIEAQDKRFAEHLAAWKSNNAHHASRIAELEKQLAQSVPIGMVTGKVSGE